MQKCLACQGGPLGPQHVVGALHVVNTHEEKGGADVMCLVENQDGLADQGLQIDNTVFTHWTTL
jgi:hypothetical protein